MRASAFSLIELTVVVAIAIVITALAAGGVMMVRKQARGTETTQRMREVSEAIATYLSRWSLPGDAAGGDFAARYWIYIGQRPFPPHGQPLLELPLAKLRRDDGAVATSLAEAHVAADGFGEPLRLELERAPAANPRWTESARIISSMGTPDVPGDDRAMAWRAESREWQFERRADGGSGWVRR